MRPNNQPETQIPINVFQKPPVSVYRPGDSVSITDLVRHYNERNPRILLLAELP